MKLLQRRCVDFLPPPPPPRRSVLSSLLYPTFFRFSLSKHCFFTQLFLSSSSSATPSPSFIKLSSSSSLSPYPSLSPRLFLDQLYSKVPFAFFLRFVRWHAS